MKKAFSKFVLLALCLTLTGCSKKDQMADYYEKELGMNKEEAQAFANAMNEAGMYGDTDQGNTAQKEEESSDFVLVAPSDQIVNSNITDPIVQVYNTVFSLDETMTVEECVNKLQADIGHELILKRGDDDITFDSLEGDSGSVASLSIKEKDTGNVICYINYINLTDAPKKIGECEMIYLDPAGWYEAASLNFFYAGNICPGIYIYNDKESKEYQDRLADYPLMTYEEIPQYLESQGFPYTTYQETLRNLDRVGSFRIEFLYSTPTYSKDNTKYYRSQVVDFIIDMNTATCSGIDFGVWPSAWYGEDFITFNASEFKNLSAKDVIKLGEAGKEFLTDSDGAEFIAIKRQHDYTNKMVLIYILGDGTYAYVNDEFNINGNGIVESEGSDWSRDIGTAASLEEIADYWGCSVSDFTMIK